MWKCNKAVIRIMGGWWMVGHQRLFAAVGRLEKFHANRNKNEVLIIGTFLLFKR